ncbi:hypothetical protein BD414DRAFT_94889 [Trametes punicea]|nr:hypothetical protein BD414DRAFT_94889 [Trametes punicea]
MAVHPHRSSAEFKNPDHFVPVKGRGGRVYCRICTPPDRLRGQPMTIAAALRHERENAKHQAKIVEAAQWDWGYQHEADWVTPNVPQGESAWEYDPHRDERLAAYVNFWLEGIQAAEQGEQPPKMDVFISRYDKAYEEENWGLKFDECDDEDEWPVEERDGILGYWYSGGSFDPLADGFETPVWMPRPRSHTSESIARMAVEQKWWPDDPDPREGWGPVVDEQTPWTTVGGGQLSQPSDVTPQQASEKTASQQRNRRRRRHRGRGRGHGETRKTNPGHVPNKGTRQVQGNRDRRVGVY